MEVTLIDWMGSDNTVADSARVSFDKEASNYSDEQNEKLIHYLAKHNHWSPFSHCFLQFRVKAPIFIARQLQKHTVGLAWNEISRRYVDFEPEFYVPETWRSRPEGSVKQGSGGNIEDGIVKYGFESIHLPTDYEEYIRMCADQYYFLLSVNVAPEQARMVLPQSMYTEWYWSGSLYAFARICNQRLGEGAQKEAGIIAQEISEHCEELFPVSWKALTNY